MDDLRDELSTQECLMGRLVKSRMKWAGHVERMNEATAYQGWYMSNKTKEDCACRLIWLDCTERGIRGTEMETEDWRMMGRGRLQWRRVIHHDGNM